MQTKEMPTRYRRWLSHMFPSVPVETLDSLRRTIEGGLEIAFWS